MKKIKEVDKATRILEAADELFGAHGYDGVSMRDVAQQAGVNKALVFYYFDGKDGLFSQVLERYYAAHRAALEGAIDPAAGLPERMHRLIDAYLDFVEGHRAYPRMVQQLLTGRGGDLTLIEASLAALHDSVAAALAAYTPASGPLAARHFFVTFSGAVINYFTYAPALARAWDRDPLSAGALAERRAHLHWLVDTVLAGFARSKEAAPS